VGFLLNCISVDIKLVFDEAWLTLLTTDAIYQVDVLGHDCDALCLDCAQVCVLEESDQVGLARLLQGHHGAALETQIGLEVLGDLAHQALEGQLCRLLVATDLTQGDRAWPVAVRLLNASGCRRAVACSLLFPPNITKTTPHEHGRPQKFFQEEQRQHFIIFKLLAMQCKWTFTERYALSTPQDPGIIR